MWYNMSVGGYVGRLFYFTINELYHIGGFMAKQQDNYLDYIPKHNSLYECRDNKKGNVEIKVHNKGLFNRIAQLIARKPKYSYIELDKFGSFVWRQMDGERNIYDISKLVKEEFGDKAEPLYERLCQFIKILHKNHFIVYINKIKHS